MKNVNLDSLLSQTWKKRQVVGDTFCSLLEADLFEDLTKKSNRGFFGSIKQDQAIKRLAELRGYIEEITKAVEEYRG